MDVRSTVERLATMGVIATVAEFERDLLIERTQSGLARAKSEGKTLGRPKGLGEADAKAVMARLAQGEGVAALARDYGISRQSIMRIRQARTDSVEPQPGWQQSTALGDADLLVQFWRVCEKTFGQARLLEAVNQLLDSVSLPPNISQSVIDAIPDTPGCYIFYGEHHAPLYIGKGISIRSRVMSHFQSALTARKEMKLSLTSS
jgi:hypothetical protein